MKFYSVAALTLFALQLSQPAHAAAVSEILVTDHNCAAINKAIHSPDLAANGTVRLEAAKYVCTEPVTMDRDGISAHRRLVRKTH